MNQILLSSNPPYGTGNAGTKSEIIALGESWAYHMGHFLSDRKYGASSSALFEQGQNYNNGIPVSGLSSHLNLLEDFDPINRPNDLDRWIPQGLFYDMFDLRNENNPVVDGVSNYSNQQFFNSLDNEVKSLPQLRVRILQQNGNNQSIQVTNLFTQYGY